MPRGRASTLADLSHGKLRLTNASSSSDTEDATIMSAREDLIVGRQKELDAIIDKHDDLVREAFHLDKYVSLLYYDPMIAKNDRSTVFQEYREKYDLMATPGAGPSRITRRAQAERVSALKSYSRGSVSVPLPLDERLNESINDTSPRSHVIRRGKPHEENVKRRAITKGKQKVIIMDDETDTEDETLAIDDQTRSPNFRLRGKRRSVGVIDEGSISTSGTPRTRSMSADDTSISSVTTLSTRRSSQDEIPIVQRAPGHCEIAEADQSLHITIPRFPFKRRAPDSVTRSALTGRSSPPTSETNETQFQLPLIKRVRLIVREPPPTFSSPRQRPPAPRFHQSLSALLSSYTEIDSQLYDAASLERDILHKARVLYKAESLRRQGKLSGVLEKFVKDGSPKVCPYEPQDVWATIVSEAIAYRNELPRHRFGRGGVIASGVSSRMRSYWDAVKMREDRELIGEEKRLRSLAKTVLKSVISEWKKVEFHVREEECRRFQAEEKLRGRRNLELILDQSGQILEKQHMDLSRADARSRSRTVSIDEMNSTDEDTEEDDAVFEEGGEELLHEADSLVDCRSIISGTADEIGSSALIHEFASHSPCLDKQMCSEETYQPSEYTWRRHSSVEAESDVLDNENEHVQLAIESGIDASIDDPLTRLGPTCREDEEHSSRELSDTDAVSASVDFEATASDHAFRCHDDDSNLPPDAENDLYNTPVLGRSFGNDPVLLMEEVAHTDKDLGTVSSSKTVPSRIMSVGLKAAKSDLPVHYTSGHGNSYEPHLNSINSVAEREGVLPASGRVLALRKDFANGHVIEYEEKNGSCSEAQRPDSAVQKERFNESVSVASEEGDSPEYERVEEGKTVTRVSSELRWEIPSELQPFAVARVDWNPECKIVPPLLLRGTLRPYQQTGLEWLASLHNNNMNGILADEMGLGKTIQTIALLAHLACDRGIWGPHLIIVPTSVLLNWEMEFKKFLPGFKILSYHGSTKRRKELRQGWNTKYAFNVCVTSYTLASRDQHIFKRKAWYYMILDEAHMIKNFRSQRWNILLMFRSYRRLLLTGTPLQNNLTELWALLQFLMSGTNFANLKDFGDWFSNPLEKAIEQGTVQNEEVQAQVSKLHTVLRPYLLRRLKRDVEKELPSKFEHLVLCRLSKRQRFLYDEFMSRRQTREDLQSGIYQKIANILMQLRKVCNHPDLFEVRPIVTSLSMEKSAIADFEIKELLLRRRLLEKEDHLSHVDLGVLGLQFSNLCNTSLIAALGARDLEEILNAELVAAYPGDPVPYDTRTIEGYRKYRSYQLRTERYLRISHMIYMNRLRCNRLPVYGLEMIDLAKRIYHSQPPLADEELVLRESRVYGSLVKSYDTRAEEMADVIDHFAFATPAVVARDMPSISLRGMPEEALGDLTPEFDSVLHRSVVKLQIAFPDVSLLQYDCGKLQELSRLLRERKAGGHRVLIFTQMTKVLDILEIFLNYHGYLYLRLDGATKIEDRQYITERFNVDERIFAFIASSRSGGVGINLTGADSVIFYDSDFNPQMDRQCEDRAHRIGQIRDVHIYRFISQHTVEEAMLLKANQKRSLDEIVIQQGGFDWRNLFKADDEDAAPECVGSEVRKASQKSALQRALAQFEDFEDSHAAQVAEREEAALRGGDQADFGETDPGPSTSGSALSTVGVAASGIGRASTPIDETMDAEAVAEHEEGGTVIDYMLKVVHSDREFFRDWKLP